MAVVIDVSKAIAVLIAVADVVVVLVAVVVADIIAGAAVVVTGMVMMKEGSPLNVKKVFF